MKTDDPFKRVWGVSLHKEKRGLRANAIELAHWGEETETLTRSFYAVRIFLLGKQWGVGTTPIRRNAALLFDSALFHLWGFAKRPQFHFNEWTEGAAEPVMYPQVNELKMKLVRHCRARGLDVSAFDYNYAQQTV